MRIGIDCRLWSQTGVGRYTQNLIKNLLKIDKKNEYVLFIGNKDFDQVKFQITNYKLQITKVDIKWHTIEEQIKLPKILDKENLDLVHFPYFSVPIFYNKPFVVTIHDLIQWHFPTGRASTLPAPLYWVKLLSYKFIIKKAAQRAKKIIAVSNATKEEIIGHLKVPEDRVEVIYEGVEPAFRNKRLASSLRTTKRYELNANRYFLYVGNAYPHKNLERLIISFQKIKDQKLKLILVGKEDYFYKKLKEKVSKMDDSNLIEFYGEANDSELNKLYSNAKALVIPSLMEGFGLPALEAMANKCLVLASDIPALREVCQGSAIYFDPYDENDMAEKLLAVNSNDTYYYSDKIKKGLKRSKMFPWRRMAEETLNLYNSVVKKFKYKQRD